MTATLFDEEVTISFKTTATVTPRTVIVSEAFGLGIDDEKTFTIYDNVRITIRQGDIVFITGDSGGGKSCLMKFIQRRLNEKNVTFTSMEAQQGHVENDEVLVEKIGETIEKALEILTRAGLGDAFLMLRKYEQLSDGQKYRYLIAKMIDSDVDVWFIDEFCAKLDRETAKVISYSIQKVARSLGKTLVAATTHEDVITDLNPSIVVKKDFGGGVFVERVAYKKCAFSLLENVTYRKGTFAEYEDSGLSAFHYKSHNRPVGLINVYLSCIGDQIVGALLSKYPPLELQERNHITNKYYTKNYKELNKDVETISRVVIHPKYRGIGLGSRLVQAYLESGEARKIVETIAVMARYNPFFERAGMTRVKIERKKSPKRYTDLMKILEDSGFDLSLITSRRYNLEKLQALTTEQLDKVKPTLMKEYLKVCALYSITRSNARKKVEQDVKDTLEGQEVNLDLLAEAIKKIKKPDLAYFIWFNPKHEHKYEKTPVTA